ncbi:TBCD protein [Neolentinus lepideus HHB14362 ss-1]|uniref:TBCD protein n=1 Tax=Neolentinus lepideus HHB14362 ss-1 TaxID=1314782 RepID=A0A165NC88_9AGAM|nr:TBCD protein [Neolentinus lepideus HHB14362 ss-1]
MDEEQSEGRFFATFEKYELFTSTQASLLSKDLFEEPSDEDDRQETEFLKNLSHILDEYQEQSYLLDPFLESLVTPAAEKLRSHARQCVSTNSSTACISRVGRIATLLYLYTKFRGYKTITKGKAVRFFPHEVSDVSIALDYMRIPGSHTQDAEQWALRYIVLLWLSLVCMIPFDLAQFNDGGNDVSAQIEAVAQNHIGKAGLERDAASILLSRLYIRKDVSAWFPQFLTGVQSEVEGSAETFKCIGTLKVIAEILKIGSAELAQDNLSAIWNIVHATEARETLMNNTIVRKLRVKVLSRTSLRILPAKYGAVHRRGKNAASVSGHCSCVVCTGRALLSGPTEEQVDTIYDDIEVPEDVETVIEELMHALQDKDTLVRWSAAKGVARIAERLSTDFGNQIFDTVLELFTIHSMAAANLYDLPAIAESTWHGACLACAEIARRGLVADNKLPELINWLSQALSFDVRKGSHSVGSSVRDAATYVLWSLARAQNVAALASLAEGLSQKLVTVSLYDREVHVRRAASAAFQEYVGRTSLFPHGIDVLRKTDFYAVGVRRNAFLKAAPEVAEHHIYRKCLIDHLLSVSLRHWDTAVRQLGAQSLRAICELDLEALGRSAASRASKLLQSVDVDDVHGGLLALAELASACNTLGDKLESEARKREIFAYLHLVPLSIIRSPRNSLVTSAACYFISTAVTPKEIQESPVKHWREIVDIGLRHRDGTVQEQAANALASVSQLVDCSDLVTYITEFVSGTPTLQQSLGRLLGALDYTAYAHDLPDAIQCLLDAVDLTSSRLFANVEARQNVYFSIFQIFKTVAPKVELFSALRDGLSDYTVDQRGDVGSWIRMACIKGLAEISTVLLFNANDLSVLMDYLPPEMHHEAIGGILKQGVERLDNVRQTAGEHFLDLLSLPLPPHEKVEEWRIDGEELFKHLYLSDGEVKGWKDSSWFFPKAVQMLQVARYRKHVLAGLVLSVGSKTDSTQRPVSQSLVKYVETLPSVAGEGNGYSVQSLVADLLDQVKGNLASNTVVIPVLQTLIVLLEADALARLQDESEGLQSLRNFLSIASRNIARLKNVQRIQESMKVIVNLLTMAPLYPECLAVLPDFFTHRFPKIRSDTAEYLYMILQSKYVNVDTEVAEEILLESEWASTNMNDVTAASAQLMEALNGA